MSGLQGPDAIPAQMMTPPGSWRYVGGSGYVYVICECHHRWATGGQKVLVCLSGLPFPAPECNQQPTILFSPDKVAWHI